MENDTLKAKEKAAAHEEANEARGQWVGGAVLIALGSIFLFSNLTDFHLNNWWALFILLPVVALWGKAFQSYQANGYLTGEARQEAMGALFPLFVACIFLFNLNWGQVWPGFIIIAGLNALVSVRSAE